MGLEEKLCCCSRRKIHCLFGDPQGFFFLRFKNVYLIFPPIVSFWMHFIQTKNLKHELWLICYDISQSYLSSKFETWRFFSFFLNSKHLLRHLKFSNYFSPTLNFSRALDLSHFLQHPPASLGVLFFIYIFPISNYIFHFASYKMFVFDLPICLNFHCRSRLTFSNDPSKIHS